jgi:hypothetical protein
MTTQDIAQINEATEDKYHASYWIDPKRFRALERSLELTLVSRRCFSCKGKKAPDSDLPAYDKQIKHISQCCAKDETFINSGMPIQEILFRLILAGRNRPKSLDDLHSQLTGRYATPGNPLNISKGALIRVLESDDYYGFTALPKKGVR